MIAGNWLTLFSWFGRNALAREGTKDELVATATIVSKVNREVQNRTPL